MSREKYDLYNMLILKAFSCEEDVEELWRKADLADGSRECKKAFRGECVLPRKAQISKHFSDQKVYLDIISISALLLAALPSGVSFKATGFNSP